MSTAEAVRECVVCGKSAGYKTLEDGEAITPQGGRIEVKSGDVVCLRHQGRTKLGSYVRVVALDE